MYSTPIADAVKNEKIFETGSRLLKFFALTIKAAVYKEYDNNETLNYFLKSINTESTVFDIGAHKDEYVFFLMKMAKRAGRLIAFERERSTYTHLLKKKEILRLKNVDIEQQSFSEETGRSAMDFICKRKEATVIDFYERINSEYKKGCAARTLDNYCINHEIIPDFIKIDGEGNGLSILHGAVKIIERYKPKILMQCEERLEGRDKILETFKFLTDLKYAGYFILDTMKIPVRNFDFNIYQNPFSNFYCKEFIFE